MSDSVMHPDYRGLFLWFMPADHCICSYAAVSEAGKVRLSIYSYVVSPPYAAPQERQS